MSEFLIPKIDPKVFRKKRGVLVNKSQEILAETSILPIITGSSRDINGGILIHYENIPFPRKGFPDAEILNNLNIVKKNLIGFMLGLASKYNLLAFLGFALTPWKYKIQSINRFLWGFQRTNGYLLDAYYYEDGSLFHPENYYCLAAGELKKLLTNFLFFLGIDLEWAEHMGEVFAMFIEHDDAWKVRVQDIFSETTKEKLFNPRQEIPRLLSLFNQRELHGFTQERFGTFGKLAVIFWHPKVLTAWRKAVKSIDLSKLQFDATDRYWALTWGTYNAMGRTREDREKELREIHKDLNTRYLKVNYQS